MTFEDHLRAEFESEFGDDPLATTFDIYTAAYRHGLRDGQIIAEQILATTREQAEAGGFLKGEAQGIAYSAYAASHVSTVDIHNGMTPAQAATQMRDNIVATLELARNLAFERTDK